MKKIVFTSVFLAFVSIFVACNENGSISYKNEVCLAGMSVLAGIEPKCKEGQIFSFQPNRWGNQQLPIYVVCVYKRRYNAKMQDDNTTK